MENFYNSTEEVYLHLDITDQDIPYFPFQDKFTHWNKYKNTKEIGEVQLERYNHDTEHFNFAYFLIADEWCQENPAFEDVELTKEESIPIAEWLFKEGAKLKIMGEE